jgi:hypothetical protein
MHRRSIPSATAKLLAACFAAALLQGTALAQLQTDWWFVLGGAGPKGDCLMEWKVRMGPGVVFQLNRNWLEVEQFCTDGDPLCDEGANGMPDGVCRLRIGLCFCVSNPEKPDCSGTDGRADYTLKHVCDGAASDLVAASTNTPGLGDGTKGIFYFFKTPKLVNEEPWEIDAVEDLLMALDTSPELPVTEVPNPVTDFAGVRATVEFEKLDSNHIVSIGRTIPAADGGGSYYPRFSGTDGGTPFTPTTRACADLPEGETIDVPRGFRLTMQAQFEKLTTTTGTGLPREVLDPGYDHLKIWCQ